MYSVDRIEVTLTVPSVEETAAWYERVLGWVAHYDAFDDEGRCIFGSVSRDPSGGGAAGAFTGLNLARAAAQDAQMTGQTQAGISVWIFVDNVDEVHTRVVESGVTPGSSPANTSWGGRVFGVRDSNGLKLTFVEMVGPPTAGQ